jgi:hypothetical protein
VVERDLAKVDVAGSTPVSRSRVFSFRIRSSPSVDFFRWERYFIEQGRGTQVVRERSAKPLCVGSIPTRASNPRNLRCFDPWRPSTVERE